jgi:hypothetical protein
VAVFVSIGNTESGVYSVQKLRGLSKRTERKGSFSEQRRIFLKSSDQWFLLGTTWSRAGDDIMHAVSPRLVWFGFWFWFFITLCGCGQGTGTDNFNNLVVLVGFFLALMSPFSALASDFPLLGDVCVSPWSLRLALLRGTAWWKAPSAAFLEQTCIEKSQGSSPSKTVWWTNHGAITTIFSIPCD